ncbi:MAG: MFS transporter [Bacillota bacterium]
MLFASGSAAFTMLERLVILYAPFFYLPPAETGLNNLISPAIYFGTITVLGSALLLGRIFDGVADPLIAALSDNSRVLIGRRKLFLLVSGLPLALSTVLVFHPPYSGGESFSNGVWLGLMMCLFYIAFTAYVNPYLALLTELGHSNASRIDLSTKIAFFGLLGMVGISVLFPDLAGRLYEHGFELREAYRYCVIGFAAISVLLLYAATLSFKEKVNCNFRPAERTAMWQSLKQTFAVKSFRLFLAGEVFLQFALNMITLGMVYYAVVIFRQEQRFMTVMAALTIGVALISFPAVNKAARRKGKKKVILFGVTVLALCSLLLFVLSWHMTGLLFYLGLAVFGLAGVPLAVLTILINPTVADLAREDALRTGNPREAMFFGARAVPLKLTIALAGVTFALLLSAFGKDLANPLGVQLSLLAAAAAAGLGYLFFARYPEQEVLKMLSLHEKE